MAETQDEMAVDPRAPVESSWGGVTKWDCPFCPVDGFERDVVQEHIDFAHPAPGLSVPEAAALEDAPSPVVEAESFPDMPPVVDTTPSDSATNGIGELPDEPPVTTDQAPGFPAPVLEESPLASEPAALTDQPAPPEEN